MTWIIPALIAIALVMIISLLLPTYTPEEEKPKQPTTHDESDPIAAAIERLRRSRA